MKRLLLLALLIAAPAFAQDKKISELPSGSPLQAGDMIPIARVGANFRLAGSDFYVPIIGVHPTYGLFIPDQTLFEGSLIIGTGGDHLARTPEGEETNPYPEGNGRYNTFVGIHAGDVNTVGTFNTFVGNSTGRENTNGDQNTFVGGFAGYHNTTGFHNTYIGTGAGQAGTTGNSNVIIGTDAALDLSTASGITLVGEGAGTNVTSGIRNTLIGNVAGGGILTGQDNTAIGYASLLASNGSRNVAVGIFAGLRETGSDKFYVDNQVRSDEATGRTQSLLYGVMAALPKNQTLTVNAFVVLAPLAFADLGTPSNGTFAYCSDCLAQASCAGSGTGAFAKRLNGAWVCN